MVAGKVSPSAKMKYEKVINEKMGSRVFDRLVKETVDRLVDEAFSELLGQEITPRSLETRIAALRLSFVEKLDDKLADARRAAIKKIKKT